MIKMKDLRICGIIILTVLMFIVTSTSVQAEHQPEYTCRTDAGCVTGIPADDVVCAIRYFYGYWHGWCLVSEWFFENGCTCIWNHWCSVDDVSTPDWWDLLSGSDADDDGHQAIGSCPSPMADDCDDNDPTVYPGAPEICDGKDNDCDGETDESTDADGDGHYTPGSCELPDDDCNDNDSAIYPGAPEICDGIDNNCNGDIDEGLSTDADGDGHYIPGSCKSPDDDCNDSDPAIYPGATEICDGIDNNCNGDIDDGLSTDADGDGHYIPGSCKSPDDDCDDNDVTVYPNASEVCDGRDNDCDGDTDEGLSTDADGDGYFRLGSCDTPNNDCNDGDAAVYPGAVELCDGIDNNCDGQTDEGCTCEDKDADGFTTCDGDCNDNDSRVYPGAPEICCDSENNDCDGDTDEGCEDCCIDSDGDGFRLCDDCNDNDFNINKGAEEICDGIDNNCDGQKDETCGGKDDDEECETSNNTGMGSSANLASGNLFDSHNIFSIQGTGLTPSFTISYNSLDTAIGPLGRGWTHNYNTKSIDYKDTLSLPDDELALIDDMLVLIQGDGKRIYFKDNGDNTYSPEPSTGRQGIITKNPDQTYTLTEKTGIKYNYASNGRLIGVTERNNNSITTAYTGDDLTSITDSSEWNRTVSIAYVNAKIDTITDPNGNIHTFTYTNDTLTEIRTQTPELDDEDIVRTFGYQTVCGLDIINTKTDPEGHTTVYEFDDRCRLYKSYLASDPYNTTRIIDYTNTGTTTVTERDGGEWIYQYNTTNDRLTAKTDPQGNTTTYQYYPDNGKLWKKIKPEDPETGFTYPEDYTTENTYYPNGNLKTVTDPLGNTTTYTYNNILEDKIATITGPAPENLTTTYNYIINNGAIETMTETDPSGAQTIYDYYPDGRIRQITNALNQTTAYTYQHDSNLNLDILTITDFLGAATQNTYDISGNMLSRTDPGGNTTTFQYNSLNRLINKTDPNGNLTTYTYDANGNRTSSTDANTNTTFYEYNYNNQLTKVTDALDNTTTYTYGGLGCSTCFSTGGDSLTSITDANGKTTTFQYDLLGKKTSQTDPNGNIISYTYNPLGRMTSLTDPLSSTTSFDYEQRGLLETRTDPLGRETTFGYDGNSRLKDRTDRNGDRLAYTYTYTPYSTYSRIDTIIYPDSNTASFTYDAIDRPIQMQDSLGITTYTYDDPNRIITVTDPHGFEVSYKNDEAGNLIELTYPNNKQVIYTYDELNRLETVTNWLGQTATYNYDPAGRLESLSNFNGTVTTYGYDNANRLTVLENRKSDTSAIATYSFILDGIGNRIQSVQNEPFTPTLAPDITEYTYNSERNRLLTAGALSFGYDFEGQLSSIDTDIYTFDYDHRLESVTGAVFAQFAYDGKGNRLEATRNGVTTRYIYDTSGNLLAEADSTNTITRYYIHGLGLLAMVTPSDGVYSYHYNAIGSTIAITDQSQNIINRYAYTPFGIIASEEEAGSQPFKFVGQYGVMTEPNGFYYMRARYYDPELGRFVSEDPIGFDGGDVNLLRYTANSPLNRIDPWGLSDIEIPIALYREIISEILSMLTEKAVGSLTGAACASRYCKRKVIPEDWLTDCWAECGSIFAKYPKLPTGIISSEQYVTACADECWKITHTEKFKKICCTKQ